MACFAFKLNDIFQTNTNTNIYINKSSVAAAAASNIFFLNLFQCVQKLLVCQLFYKINGLCTQIFQKDVFSPGFLCFAIRGMQSVSFNRGRKKITVFVCVCTCMLSAKVQVAFKVLKQDCFAFCLLFFSVNLQHIRIKARSILTENLF